MSNVSGKYDFKDHLWMSAETEQEAFNKFNGTKLYIIQPLPSYFTFEDADGSNTNIPETYYEKVEYSSIKDLIPLYPHLIAFSTGSTVCLSLESFVDREERETLEYMLKNILRIYNRYKRKKVEFDVEEALKVLVWDGWNEEAYRELAYRVKESGKKAAIDNIHLRMHEYYRRELVNELINNGLNPSDYGYGRFVDKNE